RQAAGARRRREAQGAVTLQLAETRSLRARAREHPLGDPERYRQARAAAARAVALIDASEVLEEMRPEAAALVAELGAEAEAAERDRRLLAALLEVRGPREGPRHRPNEQGLVVALAEPSAEEQFAAAFRAWGLDVDGEPLAAAVARLQG